MTDRDLPPLFELRRDYYYPSNGDERWISLGGIVGHFGTSGECVDAVVGDVQAVETWTVKNIDWAGIKELKIEWHGRSGLVLAVKDGAGRKIVYRARLLV